MATETLDRDPPPWRGGVRVALTVLATSAMAFMAGCGHRIVLPELAPITDEIADDRRVVMAGGQPISGFRVEPQDMLQIGPGDAPITLGTVEPERLVRGNEWRGATLTLQRDVARATLPIWAARSYGGLSVQVGSAEPVRICFKDGGILPDLRCAVVIGPDDKAGTLAETVSAATGVPTRVAARPAVHALPGDEIDVTLVWHQVFDTINLEGLYQFSEARRVTVGPDGTVALPRLSANSPIIFTRMECDRFSTSRLCPGGSGPTPSPIDNRAFSRERAVVAALEDADDRIVVWNEGGMPLPLWRVEWCLNAIGWRERGFEDTAAAENCRALGVDERFLPRLGGPEHFWPRYALRVSSPSWTLVDAEATAHTLPLMAGIAVEEQVRAAYSRLTGRTIDSLSALSGAPAFLVVVPADGSPAFFGQAAPGGSVGILDNVALLNGDRVFVTRLSPRAVGQ